MNVLDSFMHCSFLPCAQDTYDERRLLLASQRSQAGRACADGIHVDEIGDDLVSLLVDELIERLVINLPNGGPKLIHE